MGKVRTALYPLKGRLEEPGSVLQEDERSLPFIMGQRIYIKRYRHRKYKHAGKSSLLLAFGFAAITFILRSLGQHAPHGLVLTNPPYPGS